MDRFLPIQRESLFLTLPLIMEKCLLSVKTACIYCNVVVMYDLCNWHCIEKIWFEQIFFKIVFSLTTLHTHIWKNITTTFIFLFFTLQKHFGDGEEVLYFTLIEDRLFLSACKPRDDWKQSAFHPGRPPWLLSVEGTTASQHTDSSACCHLADGPGA